VRERRMTALAALGQRALRAIELPELLRESTELISQALKISVCFVEEYAADKKSFRCRAFVRVEKSGGVMQTIPQPVADSLRSHPVAAFALESGEPVVIEELSRETRFVVPDSWASQNMVSGIVVPMAGSRKLFGVLGMFTPCRRRFTTEDIHFAESVASMLVAAIEHRQTMEERSTFARLSARLAATTSVMEMIQVIREESERLLDWDAHYFAVRRPDEETFEFICYVDTIGGEKRVFPQKNWMTVTLSGPIGPVLRGQAVLLNREPGEAGPYLVRFGDEERPSASLLFVPVRSGERIIGILSCQSYTAGKYDESDLTMLMQFSDAVAPALVRAFAEEERRVSEERYRLLFHQSPVGLFHYDTELRVTECNERGTAILQVHRDSLMNYDLKALRDDRVLAALRKALDGKVGFYEGSHTSQTRPAKICISLRTAPIFDRQGEVRGGIGIVEDITERKHSEEDLRRTHQIYADAIENARGVPYRYNPTTEIYEFVGRGCWDLLGIRPQVLSLKTMWSLIQEYRASGGATATDPDLYYQAFRRGAFPYAQADLRITTPRGEEKWISDCCVPIRDERTGELVATLGIFQDITHRKRLEDQLRAMTLEDELTGLYNRRGFLTFARQHLKLASRMHTCMLLLFGDVNGLKSINDTYGHAMGDEALVRLAGILKSTFRESDIIARIGGDEFVVLAIESDEANSVTLTERLQAKIAGENSRATAPYPLSLSVGVARFDPERPIGIEQLLAHADMLMYEQKKKGQVLEQP
jgi:diguanylate cyclase (GGDEF)-like protein/PAS domain S-box-containing protein